MELSFMGIAALIFFIAILTGVLFLGGLIWFMFRRVRGSRSTNRNFAGNPTNHGGAHNQPRRSFEDSDDNSAIYAGSALFGGQEAEKASQTETANDAPFQSGGEYAHENRGEWSAPAEPGYYDSGSSYDSGSNSDSGSSSSDGGSSGSSSD